MRNNPGTRLVAVASLALGLTLSLSACDASTMGASPVASQNKDAGVTVREDQVQEATAGWKRFLAARGTDPSKYTPQQALYILSLEPILAEAAQTLGVAVSMDDARGTFQKELDAVRSNKVGADLPEISDPLVRLVRFDLLNRALGKADPKHPKFREAQQGFQRKISSGWSFGARYGGFALTDNGIVATDVKRPWLDTYVPLKKGSGDVLPGGGGPNGRPIEDSRSDRG